MDTTSFSAYRRASQQLSADNQATLDWADDMEFRLSVVRRALQDAVELSRSDEAETPDADRTCWRQN